MQLASLKKTTTRRATSVQAFAPSELKQDLRNAAIRNQARQKVRLLGLHNMDRLVAAAESVASGEAGRRAQHAQLMEEMIWHETQLATNDK